MTLFIPPLHLPDGYTAMGSPAPSLAIDGAGKVYYGIQSKHNGVAYAYRVWLQPASGVAELKGTIDLPGGEIESGQGQLVETDGLLIAVAFDRPGDKRPIAPPLIIDGYVPRVAAPAPRPAPIVVPADSPIWTWTGTYTPTNIGTWQKIANSLNAQKRAIAGLVELLLRAGIIARG